MSKKLQLFDLGTRHERQTSWSFNVWKTRLVLNFKQVPYTTVWLNHSTLGPTLKALGLPENTGPGVPYTVPTVQLTDGELVTDSAKIAQRLDQMYPSPSLELHSGLEAEVEAAIHAVAAPLFAIYMPAVARNVLIPSTVPVFEASRAKLFGMSLDELARTKGGDMAWQAATPQLELLVSLLTRYKVDDGPFIHGSRVCYADFMFVAIFEACKRAGDGMFERVIGYDERFDRLYEASAKWREQDE